MKIIESSTKPFDTKKSVKKARPLKIKKSLTIKSEGKSFEWSGKIERVSIIRKGIPYQYIETISEKLNVPVKSILAIFEIPQTTYNKKKNEHASLNSRDSELIILITELIDYGLEVFNNEKEKFQRWLKKPNLALGGNTPINFLDTTTGIEEVKNSLNRIEFGNFA